MNKRVFLLVASVLFLACFGFVAVTAQAPAPTPQVAPASPTPQKPTPPPAPSPGQAVRELANVRVDVTITDRESPSSSVTKMMSIVVSRNGQLRSGVNVPLPYTTFATGDKGPQAQGTPVTSYNYRNMGLSLDVTNLYIVGNLVHARISVEYNPVDATEKAGATIGMPVSYSNFSQTFELDLENGKPLVVAQTSDPVPNRDRRLAVEVKATILK